MVQIHNLLALILPVWTHTVVVRISTKVTHPLHRDNTERHTSRSSSSRSEGGIEGCTRRRSYKASRAITPVE